jgi:hypothetical protein
LLRSESGEWGRLTPFLSQFATTRSLFAWNIIGAEEGLIARNKFMKWTVFFGTWLVAGLLLLSPLLAAPAGAAPAGPLNGGGNAAVTASPVVKIHDDDDDYHGRWRSHRRWGSEGCHSRRWSHCRRGSYRDWHSSWRSHNRWGSEGYWHSRWRSHRRWDSEY